jgi:hypothetical protein
MLMVDPYRVLSITPSSTMLGDVIADIEKRILEKKVCNMSVPVLRRRAYANVAALREHRASVFVYRHARYLPVLNLGRIRF